MSIAMLKDPFKIHDFLDDMESIFWSLLIGASKYFAGNITVPFEVFFHEMPKTIDGKKYIVGGHSKHSLLQDSFFSNMQFECAPLRDLITTLSRVWRKYYLAKAEFVDTPEDTEAHDTYHRMRDQLSQPAYWKAIFDQALKREDWLKADTIQDRYPPVPAKEADIQDRDELCAAVVKIESFKGDDNLRSRSAFGHGSPLKPLPDLSSSPLPNLTPSPASSPLTDAPHSSDGVFPAVHPGPPQTISTNGGRSDSRSSYQLNSNGKRTLSIRGDDDNLSGASVDTRPHFPLPVAKKLRRSIQTRSSSVKVAGGSRFEVHSDGSVGEIKDTGAAHSRSGSHIHNVTSNE